MYLLIQLLCAVYGPLMIMVSQKRKALANTCLIQDKKKVYLSVHQIQRSGCILVLCFHMKHFSTPSGDKLLARLLDLL